MKRLALVLTLIAAPFALAEDPAPTSSSPNDESQELITLAEELDSGFPLAPLDAQIAEATRLFDAGASVAATNTDGLAALHLIAAVPNLNTPELLRLLLDRGASIDATDARGRTALMHAAAAGIDHAVQFLVLAGASTTIEDADKFTALDYALQFGQRSPASPAMIAILTKSPSPSSKGADPNHIAADGWTPLMRACQYSTGAAISTLLVFGADPNYTAPDGWTPITVAIASDDERYWMQWMKAMAVREGEELPPDPRAVNMYTAMLANWSRGIAGSPERVWALMRMQVGAPLDLPKHQSSIDRVLKGRDDPSAAAVRALLTLNNDLKARPIDVPLFGNDGAPIPTPE